MKRGTRVIRQTVLMSRIQELSHELEKLIPEAKAALADGEREVPLEEAATNLERAARALAALVGRAKPVTAWTRYKALLEGSSRLVLARVQPGVAAPPSTGAQALAILLEDPGRAYEAKEIADRLGCSVPIARTTLNRLVQSGHAARPSAGRFRAKAG